MAVKGRQNTKLSDWSMIRPDGSKYGNSSSRSSVEIIDMGRDHSGGNQKTK
jgi:hypothetical protein